MKSNTTQKRGLLTVSLGISLDFLFLLDAAAVGVCLGSLDEFVSKDFSDILEVLKSSISGVLSDIVNGLVDSSERGDINGLSLDTTSGADSGGILSGATVSDGVDDDLEGVLTGLELDDLHGLSHDSHSLNLLTSVSAVEGDAAHNSLDDGAGGFLEGSQLVTASGVGNENSRLGGEDRNVVFEAGVADGKFTVGPLAEKFGLGCEGHLKVLLAYFARFPCFILFGFLK